MPSPRSPPRSPDDSRTSLRARPGVYKIGYGPDTISLLVRGPSAKQRFLILDAATDSFFWVYGAAQESPEQRASKRLTPDQLANTITRIQHLIADLDPASRSASLDGK